MPTRDAVIAAARRYVGTPYHHQAALAGAGCDCLGLVRGVWRDLYGAGARGPAALHARLGRDGRGRAECSTRRGDTWSNWTRGRRGPGDVVLFRLRPGAIVKHAAILSTGGRMVHAVSRDRGARGGDGGMVAAEDGGGVRMAGGPHPAHDAARLKASISPAIRP